MHPRNLATSLVVASAFLLAHHARAQSVEDLLDKLNRLPPNQRQQRLADGARK